MKIICRPRHTGKTVELIKLASESDAYIVCSSHSEAVRLSRTSYEMGMRIRFPLTFYEFVRGRFYGSGCPAFVVDDADKLLQFMAGGVPVLAVTVTQDES